MKIGMPASSSPLLQLPFGFRFVRNTGDNTCFHFSGQPGETTALHGFDMKSELFLPPGYQFLADDCKRFFDDHPDYNKNVFIMTRFVPGNKLLEELDSEVRRVLRKNCLNPLRGKKGDRRQRKNRRKIQ